jgi:uncharacterized protein (TIGR00290 family)
MVQWREAGPSDVRAIHALVQAAYRGHGGWTNEAGLVEGERISCRALAAEIESPASVVMVVPALGGIRACCVVRGGEPGGEPGVAHFGLFAVAPAEQGRGTGRRLLAEARRVAAQRFAAELLEISVLAGQSALIGWYERRGFAATGATIPFPEDPTDRPLVPGLRFIVMRAPIRRPAYALSWSGGKDSALALHALTAGGEPAPTALLTTVTAGDERISMHGVRRELLHRQARALGIELVEVRIEPAASNESYERAVAGALRRSSLAGIEEIAFGDLFLQDVRDYRERQCAAVGLRARFPLWALDTRALARRFIALGFRARIVCLDPRVMPPALAGRPYDEQLLAELPRGVDPCGENGEFHTFVHDGPGFRSPVTCRPGEVVTRDGFVFADLLAGR